MLTPDDKQLLATTRRLAEVATGGEWCCDETKALGAYFVWLAETLGTADAKMICRLGSTEQAEWLKTAEERTANGHYIAHCSPANVLRLVELCERLAAVVEKLPQTADGVPVVPGMPVFGRWEGDGYVYAIWKTDNGCWLGVKQPGGRFERDGAEVYSTREAAQAAGGSDGIR